MRTAALPPLFLLLAALPLVVGCSALGSRGPASLILDTATLAPIPLEALADELAANYDVVFLGEQHDSDECHRLQYELTRMLWERRGEIAISMEMIERHDQEILDRYLEGLVDEATFVASAKLWPNYDPDYRRAVELARREGLPVLAGNIPRPLAARVVKEGINAVIGEEFTPRQVHVASGEYKELFIEVMGGHGGDLEQATIDNVFAAQCIKDDAMSESIADYLIARSSPRPLVVHWVGAFHSDYGLGTVERLRQRLPGLRIAVLSTVKYDPVDATVDPDDLAKGSYLFVVRR